MIKRQYFISARKYHNDGSGGYLWRWSQFTYISWFRNDVEAFDVSLDALMDELDVANRHDICVIAFNRL